MGLRRSWAMEEREKSVRSWLDRWKKKKRKWVSAWRFVCAQPFTPITPFPFYGMRERKCTSNPKPIWWVEAHAHKVCLPGVGARMIEFFWASWIEVLIMFDVIWNYRNTFDYNTPYLFTWYSSISSVLELFRERGSLDILVQSKLERNKIRFVSFFFNLFLYTSRTSFIPQQLEV